MNDYAKLNSVLCSRQLNLITRTVIDITISEKKKSSHLMQIQLFDLFLLNYLRGMKTDKEESRGQYGQTFTGLMAHVQGENLAVDRKTVFTL